MVKMRKVENAGEGHNSEMSDEDKARVVDEAMSTIIALEAKKATIQKQIQEAKAPVKAFMKVSEFNVVLRYRRMDREERAAAIEELKVAWAALGQGEQLDFIATQAAGE